MVELFGLGFSESQLISVVDSMLKVGSEGQAKAFRGKSKSNSKIKPGPKTKPVKSKHQKRGHIIGLTKGALDSTPKPTGEIFKKIHAKAPEINTDQVSKALASMYVRKLCKRKGTKPILYYVE